MNAAEGGGIERLLVVRLSAMGDVIHTLPSAKALREAFPEAMIGWLIEERWAELLCAPGTSRRGPRSPQRPLVDWVHTVNLRGWRKSLFELPTIELIARVWNDVRAAHYQIAIDLQGAIRSAVLARWSGAPVIYGSAQPRETPASLWYTQPVITHGAHVIEQNLSIVESVVGQGLRPSAVEFPHDEIAEERIGKRLRELALGEFAILNPGAGWGAKRWPATRYGEVARMLAGTGLSSVINVGPNEESLAREVESSSGGAARAVMCSISELIALTRRADLFIGGDTGPLHLAAALGVPVVAIFGPTDPARNGPYEFPTVRDSRRVGHPKSVVLRNPSSPTTHARVARPDEAMLDIGVDDVVEAARHLLTDPPGRESAHG